jgi:hypothetical protein
LEDACEEQFPKSRFRQLRLLSGKWLVAFFLVLFLGATGRLNAALQFDVFLGYDDIVPEASWFPVICELKNDGPAFVGIVEVSPGSFSQGQIRRATVELPTGTLKRLNIPVFSTTRGYTTWDVRLLDERGKVRAEKIGMRPTKQLPAGTPLMGAITRKLGGKPTIKPVLTDQDTQQPPSAGLLTAIFPDNPLVLEGMTTLYLSSEKASELRVPNQVEALYAWLNAGGHLIVGVEQLADITSVKWLNNLFPVELQDMKTLPRHPELQAWIKSTVWATNTPQPGMPMYYPQGTTANRRRRGNLPAPPVAVEQPTNPAQTADLTDDYKFETSAMQVAVGALRDGKVELSVDNTPLIVTATRGRGRVTALLFSPEREPFVSWKNLPTFWAKVSEVPANWYASQRFGVAGGMSSDGIFGAMIDSRQIHKLPVEWLLLLLIVYLVVIGPFDQFWLKKIGRPMLTWITFPCYVVMFSLLIYFIGYKLRAGEAEWNELHVVDVLMNGDKAELRGRTYASVYAPSNQRYLLESQEKFATLRGEFQGAMGGGQSSEKATIVQNGDSFKAEIFVPVWTSQLFVSDWWQPSEAPFTASVSVSGDGWQVKVENRTEQKLSDAQIVIDRRVFKLGEIAPSKTQTFKVVSEQGVGLKEFVSNHGREFQGAVNSRQSAFGGRESGKLNDLPNCTLAASFVSQLEGQESYMNNFISPPGLDMSNEIEHGGAVLFAWAEDYSPVKPLYQIKPKRSHKQTMFRMPLSLKSKA